MAPNSKRDKLPTIKDCKILGKAFTVQPRDIPDKLDDCATDLDLTMAVIKQLLKSKSPMVQRHMIEANFDAKRVISRKIIYNKGDKTLASVSMSRPHHEYALVHYLFVASSKKPCNALYDGQTSFMERHKHDCITCGDPQTAGPFMECLTFDDSKDGTDLRGACLNCYYTGRSTTCSFRKEWEDLKLSEEIRTMAQIKEEVAEATIEEMDTWMPIVKDELGQRSKRKMKAWEFRNITRPEG